MVAYLIMSYTDPELVRRLVARLRGGLVAVHHDPRRVALGPVDALVIPPVAIEWGHGSQLAAVLRCLGWLRDHEWDAVVLLSGQDYPIRPRAEIEASLTGADAFIQLAPVAPLRLRRGGVDEFARRYRHRWRPASERVARLAAHADPLAHVRRLPSGTYVGLPARPPLPPFHGSDWFTLSRRAVDAVLGAPPELVDHFLHTIVPTEAFVHTVVGNDTSLRVVHDNRRYVRFDGPTSANPRVLGLDDLDAALASGNDFARKFDSLAVLDAIDRRIL